jgi:hypothetical protein
MCRRNLRHAALDRPQGDAASRIHGAICPMRCLPRVVKNQCRAGRVGPSARSASTPDIHRPTLSQSINRAQTASTGRPIVVSAVNTSANSRLPDNPTCVTLRPARSDVLDELHSTSGTKPAEVAASVRSYVERCAARYWPGVTPVWRLKSRSRLVEPSQLCRLIRPPTDPYTSISSSNRRIRRMRPSVC